VAIARRSGPHAQNAEISALRRYRGQGVAQGEAAATLFLLLDLATYFDLYHAGKLPEALDTLAKLKLVPLAGTEVDQRVSAFRVLGEDVRRNLPDILVAAMTALHSQYQAGKGGGQARVDGLREQAKSLITYAGMIPYRLPGDTNARLVQLEVLMN
jgi:nuclear pore complex protein Nup93